MANTFASLDELAGYYKRTKPANDGSEASAEQEKIYFSNYLDDLEKYNAESGGTEDFSKYQIMRNYVSGQKQTASDYYSNLKLIAKNSANSKVQQGVLKDNSLKMAQVSLNAAGLGGSGVAGSVQAGIGNQYNSNVNSITNEANTQSQDAYENYKTTADSAAISQEDSMNEYKQSTSNTDYDLASELINSGVDLDTVLSKYGEGLTDVQKSTLKDLSDASNGNSAADKYISYSSDKTAYDSYDSLKGITLDNGKKAGDFVDHEIKYLMGGYGSNNDGFQDKLVNGFVVRLGNGSSGNDYGSHLYLVYKDGKWYKTTEKAFTQATNKQTIQGK